MFVFDEIKEKTELPDLKQNQRLKLVNISKIFLISSWVMITFWLMTAPFCEDWHGRDTHNLLPLHKYHREW